jgi:phosphatidylinositol alpha-mannosyltransferase
MMSMRIALVSPYSWTYPGGVTRHIEALAERFLADGHDVRVLAPFDTDGRLSTALHRGARPQLRPAPDYLVSLGRSVGFKANGAVSNLSVTPYGVATMHQELRRGGYDVVHIHEPIAPVPGWVSADTTRLPLVGTFHSFSESRFSNGMANLVGARRVLNHLHVRIAVSEAAAWTGRRFFGGHYRVIPNGVEIPSAAIERVPGDRLRIVFVGQAVERKGLPILLRAFEALREQVLAELTLVGASAEEIAPLLLDCEGIRALGKVSEAEKLAALAQADVLCAPSLGGESFGMVLTEAFAAGVPVVASDIAGYRDVVRDGIDGLLVPRGDAQAVAEGLRDLWLEPERRLEMGEAAAERALRFAWPHVAAEVLTAYEDAIATPAPAGAVQRAAVRIGARPADLKPHVRPHRLPSPEPPLPCAARPHVRFVRRAALAAVSIGGLLLAVLALQKIGIGSVTNALIGSSPWWVLVGLATMCGAMVLRGFSWNAILRAALPDDRVRLADVMQGTFIGVLMSATLPARLGEPSRALVIARRIGRPRESLPVVLGTVVSQTLLNIVALIILGAVMFSSVNFFAGHQSALLFATIAPAALLIAVLLAPALLRSGAVSRSSRIGTFIVRAREALIRVRSGLIVFRNPKLGAIATVSQLAAWAFQAVSCYTLLIALGLDHQAGIGAAAAVLFAVNITAVLPATPANVGVFQAACAWVLHAGWHISYVDGVAYGVILQAVEVSTALLMGMPALLREGLSWREVRLRAMNTAPVKLPALPATRRREAIEEHA